ncbi:CaiB/BaiF CoA transferase family protein [Streptomyces chartreusis]|uniref:CaiB/BaiF CoA transferase family protein n=1 Tax=Streptomyces chartreusis TaxID=1969 RepID=UPI003642EC6C
MDSSGDSVPERGLPLAGVRVLDLTHAVAGSYTAMILGDLGAEIIKVEKPVKGDMIRALGEELHGTGLSDYYVSVNRNKRSVALDMRTPEAVRILTDIARVSDVVIQNLKPGSLEKLGLGYAALKEVNPDLVYCSITGYGPVGPLHGETASDVNIQAATGLMATTGEIGGAPLRIGTPIVDISTGLYAYGAIVTALLDRDRTGAGGQHLEIPMYEVGFSIMANLVPAVATLGRVIPRGGRGHPQIVPYETFRCRDGIHAMVGAFSQPIWHGLCRAIESPELITDPRFETNEVRLKHRQELSEFLAKVFVRRDFDEWAERLGAEGVSFSQVLEVHQALATEQAAASGIAVPVDLGEGRMTYVVKDPIHSDSWPGLRYEAPPVLGSDGPDVLAGLLGMDAEEIRRLVEAGVLEVPYSAPSPAGR